MIITYNCYRDGGLDAMIGIRLKELRIKSGHTQESLAELLSTDARQIWRWENDHTEPSTEAIAKIAKALNTSTDYLLGLTDDPNPPTAAGLSEKELAVITAWRRGERIEAMRVIANDE